MAQSGNPPGETYKHLMKSAEEIREHQKAMCTGDVLELDDRTKKLQQAYSKFNHKLRKAHQKVWTHTARCSKMASHRPNMASGKEVKAEGPVALPTHSFLMAFDALQSCRFFCGLVAEDTQ